MWHKLSFYRQAVISTIISAALVFLVIWIRRRNQTTGTIIRLLPQRNSTETPHTQKATSDRVPVNKSAKIQIAKHMTPDKVTPTFTPPPKKYKQQKTSKKIIAPDEINIKDDLTIILGIGPKTAAAFHKTGILSFKDIAKLDAQSLNSLLREFGIRTTRTETWPEQASVAAKGDFKRLKEIQETLKSK